MPALACALLLLAALTAGLGPVLALGIGTGAGLGESFIALWGDPYLRRVLGFTVAQAGLSTLLAVLGAIPIARALARRPAFPGRGLLLHLLAVPLLLPALVGVLALVTLYGQQGWAAQLVRAFGGEMPPLYGLGGILLAHVFSIYPWRCACCCARSKLYRGKAGGWRRNSASRPATFGATSTAR
ncbi:ABC transporter permease family protein [Elstera litoralis]|uniref:hypothetical protein n=1 Tax=Elstera litoralis TaxID=552518 RepID=UPI0006982ED3|nr:hypothetical protein [Elstera litoralis]